MVFKTIFFKRAFIWGQNLDIPESLSGKVRGGDVAPLEEVGKAWKKEGKLFFTNI